MSLRDDGLTSGHWDGDTNAIRGRVHCSRLFPEGDDDSGLAGEAGDLIHDLMDALVPRAH